MPEARLEISERPANILPGHSSAHVLVVGHIDLIVQIHEIVLLD